MVPEYGVKHKDQPLWTDRIGPSPDPANQFGASLRRTVFVLISHLIESCWTSACGASLSPSSPWVWSSASCCCRCSCCCPSPSPAGGRPERAASSYNCVHANTKPQTETPLLLLLTSSEHCMRGQIQWMSSSLWSSALRLFRVDRSSSSSGESDCGGRGDGGSAFSPGCFIWSCGRTKLYNDAPESIRL